MADEPAAGFESNKWIEIGRIKRRKEHWNHETLRNKCQNREWRR